MLLKILLLGEHTNFEHDGFYSIHPLTSSVTLLSDGKIHVIFDTGSLAYQEQILKGLEEVGLRPSDITHVCLTHFHIDHTANIALFRNAEIHAHRSYLDHKTGVAYIFSNPTKRMLPLGIVAHATPGHSPDHMSYFFENDGVKYCVAGDAIREDNIREGGPHYYDDARKNESYESMKYIFANSNVIIPGHFRIIEGELKVELERCLNI